MKLTLDTNCLFDLWNNRERKILIEVLVGDAQKGLCNLAITSRISADIPDNPLASELYNLLQQRKIEMVGTIARWNVSYWGDDYWAGDEIEKLESKITAIMFPGVNLNEKEHQKHLRDTDHLIGHIINERDYFVTSDKDFTRCRDRLKKELNVKIVTPAEYVSSIRIGLQT